MHGIMVSDSPRAAHAPDDWVNIAAAARCWSRNGDAFLPVAESTAALPPGVYRCRVSQAGPYLEKMPIEIDDLLALPDGTVEKLLEEFSTFWTLKDKFAQHGFTFKRGMLLYGPPGSGKTSAIWQMAQRLVHDHNGIVIFVEEPNLASHCVGFARRIEPTRPMVCVMEDIDALVRNHGDHGFLAMLDGETQISNVVHIATTNYPEELDRRFVDRPSRFDTIMLVDMPSEEARRVYFSAKEPNLDKETLERWVSKTDGYSIAHLREVIIATQCFGQTEDQVFKRMDEMRESKPTSSDSRKRSTGFLPDRGRSVPNA